MEVLSAPEFRLNEDHYGVSINARMTELSDGNFAAVWMQGNGRFWRRRWIFSRGEFTNLMAHLMVQNSGE